MNRKLSAIEINDFRIYKGKQLFDFTVDNSDKVADIVVIYAPNGYGKTSFFDAIEWAVTGQIGRISQNKIIKEEMEREYGPILKNKYSPNKYGSVKLISNHNEILEVNTKEIKGKMKHDYREGETLTNQFGDLLKLKDSFCSTNLLAHDKITSFLNQYSSNEKYKALAVFWDEKGDSKILNQIMEIEKLLEKKYKDKKKEVSANEKELRGFKFEENKIQETKDKIVKLNLTEKDLNLVCDIDTDLVKALKQCDEKEHVLQGNKVKYNEELQLVETLIKEYYTYQERRRKILKVGIKQQYYATKKLKLTKLEILKKEKEERKKIHNLQEYLIKNWNAYFEQMQQLSIEEKEIIELESSNIKIKKEKEELTYSLNELQGKLDNQKKLLIDNKEKLNNIKDNLNEYSKVKGKIEKIAYSINWREQLLKLRRDKYAILNNNVSELKLYIAGEIERQQLNKEIEGLLKNLIAEKVNKIEELKKVENNLKEQIKDKKESYNEYLEIDNKINSILQEGKKIIIDNKLSECPLCHAQYSSFESLLERISNTFEDAVKLQQLNSNILNLENLLQQNLLEQHTLEEYVNQKINEMYNQKQNEYNQQRIKIQRIENEITSLKGELIIAKVNKSTIISTLSNFAIKDIEKANIDEVEKENEIIDIELKNQLSNIEEQIKQMTIQRDTYEKQLKDNNIQILNKKKNSIEIKNEELVIQYKKTLAMLDINDINCDIRQLIDDIKQEYNKVEKDIEGLVEKINNIKIKDNESIQRISIKQQEYINKLDELRNQQKRYIYRYKQICISSKNNKSVLKKHSNTKGLRVLKSIIKEELEYKREELLSKISVINNSFNLIKDINLDINKLMTQQTWYQKKKDNEQIKIELQNIVTKKEEIAKCREMCEKYITEVINEYFDVNTINQIYSKIDPHPSMTHIKFKPELRKAKQEVHVYIYDEKEEAGMSPVLYLSSAQVNILSLSIFLAKVLTETQIALDTIFMDDPIQHLDGINMLSFIDLLRSIITSQNRQIIISTHNENFFKLMKMKMDSRYYASKFIELSSAGKIVM